MRRCLRWIAALSVLVLLAGGAFVAWFLWVPASWEARLAAVERQAQRGLDRGCWPGVMWAVVAPGEVLALGAAGMADVAAGREMSPETTMPVGSISKVLVGLAAAEAIVSGDLDPDAPLATHVGFPLAFPDNAPRSFSQLATHTSGIADSDAGYEEVGYHYGTETHPVPLEDFLQRYLSAEGDLYVAAENFTGAGPGEVYSYSNIGAGLAGHVVERATGRTLPELTRAGVTGPLGLTGFWGQEGPASEAPRAVLYDRDESGAFAALPPYGLAIWPDGQFNGSARDLARLMAAILGSGMLDGDEVLRPEVVTELVSPRIEGSAGLEEEEFVGLFWTREVQRIGPLKLTFVGHSGGDPGVITFMYRKPGNPTAFVLMFNGEPEGLPGILAIVRLARTLGGMSLPPG